MSEIDAKQLAERLGQLLPDQPSVRITGVASVGAQRQTLFLELGDAPEPPRAVAQIATGAVAATPVDVEAALVQAAAKAGVPVPRLLAHDASLGVLLCEHVEGETIPRRVLRAMQADPERAARLTDDCGRALAAIHRIPVADLPELEDCSDASGYTDRLEELLDGLSTPHPSLRLGLHWLRGNTPPMPDETRLVHGDFRNGNLIVGRDGLAAVLDWEVAHAGDPMEDLAWLCLRTWRFGEDALPVGGFGRLEALRSAYESAGGRWRQEAFHWWTVARTLWWGIGLARQCQAFLEGRSDSIVLAASGRRVAELEYDLLRLVAEGPAAT